MVERDPRGWKVGVRVFVCSEFTPWWEGPTEKGKLKIHSEE